MAAATLAVAAMASTVHPSAWEGHSPNFGLRGFYEVRRRKFPESGRNAALIQLQFMVPESVKVFPATGTNSHS